MITMMFVIIAVVSVVAVVYVVADFGIETCIVVVFANGCGLSVVENSILYFIQQHLHFLVLKLFLLQFLQKIDHLLQ
jgi:hypothetical protein